MLQPDKEKRALATLELLPFGELDSFDSAYEFQQLSDGKSASDIREKTKLLSSFWAFLVLQTSVSCGTSTATISKQCGQPILGTGQGRTEALEGEQELW